MYELGASELNGSVEELARVLGCLPEEVTRCCVELMRTKTADVRFGNGDVSILSRRLQRELTAKENNRLYVQRHRSKVDVRSETDDRVRVKSKEIEIREEKKKKATTPKQTDDEWLESLTKTEAYKQIPVLKEFDKAKIWTDANGRQCTRRFFIGWLNRIKPMEVTNGYKPDPGRPKEYDKPYIPEPPCEFCGKEICFSNHDEERREVIRKQLEAA